VGAQQSNLPPRTPWSLLKPGGACPRLAARPKKRLQKICLVKKEPAAVAAFNEGV